jgi:hypothetical protein
VRRGLLTALRSVTRGTETVANHFDAEADNVNIVGVAQDAEDHEYSEFPRYPWLRPLVTSSPLHFDTGLNLIYEANAWAMRFLGGLCALLRRHRGRGVSHNLENVTRCHRYKIS